jgi:hypothetical protein
MWRAFIPKIAFTRGRSGCLSIGSRAPNPVPTEKDFELMAHRQAVALNARPKPPVREYMGLKFVNVIISEEIRRSS